MSNPHREAINIVFCSRALGGHRIQSLRYILSTVSCLDHQARQSPSVQAPVMKSEWVLKSTPSHQRGLRVFLLLKAFFLPNLQSSIPSLCLSPFISLRNGMRTLLIMPSFFPSSSVITFNSAYLKRTTRCSPCDRKGVGKGGWWARKSSIPAQRK